MRARLSQALAMIFVLGLAPGASHAWSIEDIMIQPMALDTEDSFNGVDVACTGVGETRLDPKWAAYPVRVEFSNARNDYMTDAAVVLTTAKGKPLLALTCEGPWVLLRPQAGSYAVYAQLMDSSAKPRSSRFTAPAPGRKAAQKRVVLQFPDA